MATEGAVLISNRYRLDRRIASGGMGTVWEARDQILDRSVAVKLLHDDLARDSDFRRRFRTEARSAARLVHPGAVNVFDYGEQDGTPFLVMELVAGDPLHEVLRHRGALSTVETMSVVAQTASVLAAAHAGGLVHRDIKPANLLLDGHGRVKVTDFGIARPVGLAARTVGGAVFGTVSYMSPEQVRGEPVSEASDIYSLGVLAFECLTGERPFVGGESLAVAMARLQRPAPPLPHALPPEVRSLVAGMLAKDPAHRPASARAVAEAANRLIGQLAGADLATGPSHDGANDRAVSSASSPFPVAAEPSRRRHTGPRGARPSGVPYGGQHAGDDPTMRHTTIRRPKRPAAVLGAVAVALLMAGGVLTGLTAGASPQTVRVPDLRGQVERTATDTLRAADLRDAPILRDIAGAARGLVVDQRPAPGALVHPGSPVSLTVASGFVDLRAVSLLGLPYTAAASKLRHEGLVPSEVMLASTGSSAGNGDVASVRPSGRLREGATVVLSVATRRQAQVVSTTPRATPAPPVTSTPFLGPPARAPQGRGPHGDGHRGPGGPHGPGHPAVPPAPAPNHHRGAAGNPPPPAPGPRGGGHGAGGGGPGPGGGGPGPGGGGP